MCYYVHHMVTKKDNVVAFKTKPNSVYRVITASTLKNFQSPNPSKDFFIRDEKLSGFYIRIRANGTITYAVEARVHGKGRKKSRVVGNVNLVTARQAREIAVQYLQNIKKGMHQESVAGLSDKKISISNMIDEYADIKDCAPRTHLDMKEELSRTMAHLSNTHLPDITVEDIKKWWVTNKYRDGSRRKALRYAQAITNYAIASETKELKKNVFANFHKGVLGHLRKLPPRTKQILEEDMESWVASFVKQATPHQKWLAFDGVPHSEEGITQQLWDISLKQQSRISETQRDYILFLMITGKRKGEAAIFTWDKVDLEGKKKKIVLERITTKGKKKDDHIPMTNLMWHMLKHRYNSPDRHKKYVFPNNVGTKPINNISKSLAKISKDAKIPYVVSAHDFRRTFSTHAVISGYKREDVSLLLAHAKPNVTEDYILRDHMAKRDKLETIEKCMFSPVHDWIKTYWYGADENQYFFSPEPSQEDWDRWEGKESYYT